MRMMKKISKILENLEDNGLEKNYRPFSPELQGEYGCNYILSIAIFIIVLSLTLWFGRNLELIYYAALNITIALLLGFTIWRSLTWRIHITDDALIIVKPNELLPVPIREIRVLYYSENDIDFRLKKNNDKKYISTPLLSSSLVRGIIGELKSMNIACYESRSGD